MTPLLCKISGSLPYSSSSPLQPPFLKPFCRISSIFFMHLLQRNKLLPTSVATPCTLERNRKSREDGANTRWEQPCCVCWEKWGVCVFDRFTRRYGEWVGVIFVSVLHPWVSVGVCGCLRAHNTHVSIVHACMRQREERRGFISTCQQWVFKRHEAACLRVFSLLMHFPVGLCRRDQKVLGRKPKSNSLRQLTVQHLSAETPKAERGEEGNEGEGEGMRRRRRSAFTCGGGSRLMLACILEVICGRL